MVIFSTHNCHVIGRPVGTHIVLGSGPIERLYNGNPLHKASYSPITYGHIRCFTANDFPKAATSQYCTLEPLQHLHQSGRKTNNLHQLYFNCRYNTIEYCFSIADITLLNIVFQLQI